MYRIAPSGSPMNDGIGCDATRSSSPESSAVMVKYSRRATSALNWSRSTKSAWSRSTGTSPPSPTWFHAAARNSRLVRRRLSARARTRSGATTMTVAVSGKNEMSGTTLSTSAGRSDSMPVTAIPSEMGSASARRDGVRSARSAARFRTPADSGISRTAVSSIDAISPRERWSAMENSRRSSMSSPKKSHRIGCPASGGKTSRIPPRIAISPRRDTMSTR